MISADEARSFAVRWIEDWNTHDLERILAHYSEDVRFASPFVAKFTGNETGVLDGKAVLRKYWSRALAADPDLHFELIDVLAGARSVVVYYRRAPEPTRRAAEMMVFGEDGLIVEGSAHYEVC